MAAQTEVGIERPAAKAAGGPTGLRLPAGHNCVRLVTPASGWSHILPAGHTSYQLVTHGNLGGLYQPFFIPSYSASSSSPSTTSPSSISGGKVLLLLLHRLSNLGKCAAFLRHHGWPYLGKGLFHVAAATELTRFIKSLSERP